MSSLPVSLSLLLAVLAPAIDSVRSALEATEEKWFWRLLISSLVVALGCVLETGGTAVSVTQWWRARKGLPVKEEDPTSWRVPAEAVGLLLVIVGVIGEATCETRASKAETNLRAHDERILADALQRAGDAKVSAEGAAQAARNAGETAADAEQRLTGALLQALRLQHELDRLRSPRSIRDAPRLISILKQYKGTEYRLNVFADEEAIDLLRKVDAILSQAGWIRKQPETADPNTPTLGGVLSQDQNSLIPTCVETGVLIWVRSTFSINEMSRPLQQSPREIQAARTFISAFASRVYPQDIRKVARQIGRRTEEESMVICVGKKP